MSERKHRLLATALCRSFWSLLDHEHSRRAVEIADRYADGQATRCQGPAPLDCHPESMRVPAVQHAFAVMPMPGWSLAGAAKASHPAATARAVAQPGGYSAPAYVWDLSDVKPE